MDSVRLIYALKPHQGEKWYLDRTRKGLVLRDEDENVVAKLSNADAGLRIRFPSFWASVAHLTIEGDGGERLCFEPKPKAVTRVQEMVQDCLDSDPAAAAAVMHRKANRDLLIGGTSFLVGSVITGVSFLASAPGGTFVVTTGLLAIGLFEIVHGIYWKVKAGERERAAEEQ